MTILKTTVKSVRLAGIIEDSIVDGPGLRFVIFAQGCPHKCRGCHNKGTHNFDGGFKADIQKVAAKIINSHVTKLTFSGGEPFCQACELAKIARLVKVRKLNIDIITYTGYRYEELFSKARMDLGVKELLSVTDYLVDGKYEQNKKSMDCFFRGSSNQRIFDIMRYPDSVNARLIERREDWRIK
jgi:anaerobic ribonucleoside-triphosphate reductase activating protein